MITTINVASTVIYACCIVLVELHNIIMLLLCIRINRLPRRIAIFGRCRRRHFATSRFIGSIAFSRSKWNIKNNKKNCTQHRCKSYRRLPADRFGTDRRRPIPIRFLRANILILLYNDNIELLLPIGQGHHHQTSADNDNNKYYIVM